MAVIGLVIEAIQKIVSGRIGLPSADVGLADRVQVHDPVGRRHERHGA